MAVIDASDSLAGRILALPSKEREALLEVLEQAGVQTSIVEWLSQLRPDTLQRLDRDVSRLLRAVMAVQGKGSLTITLHFEPQIFSEVHVTAKWKTVEPMVPDRGATFAVQGTTLRPLQLQFSLDDEEKGR